MKNPRFSITVTLEEYEQLKNIADKRHCSLSEVCRSYIQDGLNGDLSKSNIDFISKIMREQIKSIIQPGIERLAALNAKTCMQASTSAFLNAEVLAKFVPLDQQLEYQNAYNAARKQAAQYMRNRIDTTDFDE